MCDVRGHFASMFVEFLLKMQKLKISRKPWVNMTEMVKVLFKLNKVSHF
jgi:hypothetical protein